LRAVEREAKATMKETTDAAIHQIEHVRSTEQKTKVWAIFCAGTVSFIYFFMQGRFCLPETQNYFILIRN
jgi:hypothetical protein